MKSTSRYTCFECDRVIYAAEQDKGTTPLVFPCECGSLMRHNTDPVSIAGKKATHVFRAVEGEKKLQLFEVEGQYAS